MTVLTCFAGSFGNLTAGQDSWQQDVHYLIDVELDDVFHTLTGTGKIIYTNHSPDTLYSLYLNLYVNAFRKKSNMHLYQNKRYEAFGGGWIGYLPPHLLGDVHINSITDQNGNPLPFETDDTILKTDLLSPAYPGGTISIVIEFTVKLPLLIRRMGRNNREGVAYSVAQWYPKICVYDRQGWHLDYYLGREFFGEIGTYDVSITLPADYMIGATGRLINAPDPAAMMNIPPDTTRRFRLNDSIVDRIPPLVDTTGLSGLGLDQILSGLLKSASVKTENPLNRTWRFHQDRVHDFAWCADREYVYSDTIYNSTRIHILHKPDVADAWRNMKAWIIQILRYMEAHVGPYPYADLTVAQAGDGGMEYPTITFITGRRGEYSLASVTAHEIIHNWFYGVLANDEVNEPWLDEGITSYYTTRVMESMFGRYAMRDRRSAWPFTCDYADDARNRTFSDYEWWAKQGYEEPVIMPADRYRTDESYGYSVYTKGHVFMNALEYYFGRARFDELMKKYYRAFAHRHVSTETLRRFLEKESGAKLDHLFYQWLRTTDQCDYAVGAIRTEKLTEHGQALIETRIDIHRKEKMIMPVDVYLQLKSGEWIGYRIPSHTSDPDIPGLERRPVWNPFDDRFTLIVAFDEPVRRAVIDTSLLMPDIHRADNQSGFFPPVSWPFRKPVQQPPALNLYRIEHRPSFWFNHPEGLRAGYAFFGKWAVDEHRVKTGFFYGARNRQPDYEMHYQTPLYAVGRQTELSVQSYKLEGRSSHEISVIKKWYGAGFDYPSYHTLSAGVRYERLLDDAYLPTGVAWGKGHLSALKMNYEYQPGYRRETLLKAGLETSFLQSDKTYARAELSFFHIMNWIPKAARLRYRAYLGYSSGEVPVHDRFYLAGASPREQFGQPFFRSAGTVPKKAWINGANRHWYFDGGGSLSGYYNANLRSLKIWTHSLDMLLTNPVQFITKKDLLFLNRSEPFLFIEGGMFWNRDRDIIRNTKKATVFDSGAGIDYLLSFLPGWWGKFRIRAEFPFWVSRPSLNGHSEKSIKHRWVVGLIKE